MRTEIINEIEFEIGKLDVFKQLHVGRKLAPLLAHSLPALAKIATDEEGGRGADPSATEILRAFVESGAAVPIASTLSEMKAEDFEYVVRECLAVCQRKQSRGWAQVYANGVLMFADLEADTVIQLTAAVIEVSLGRFFPTGQSKSAVAPA